MKRAEQVQLHLVAVGKVGLYFLHKGFDDVLHVAFCHGAILLDIGGEDIDVHRTAGFGLLTEIIQLGRVLVAHDFTAFETLYKYIHKIKS